MSKPGEVCVILEGNYGEGNLYNDFIHITPFLKLLNLRINIS